MFLEVVPQENLDLAVVDFYGNFFLELLHCIGHHRRDVWSYVDRRLELLNRPVSPRICWAAEGGVLGEQIGCGMRQGWARRVHLPSVRSR